MRSVALLLIVVTGCAAALPVNPPPATPVTVALSVPLGHRCGTARFWSDGTAGRTWQQARDFCRSVGGDLASIHDERERICANQVLALSGTPPVGAWIGVFEDQREGAWRWSDGTPTDFMPWLDGEPNNDSHEASDCGHAWRDQAFQWNDIPCSRTDPTFLCRLP